MNDFCALSLASLTLGLLAPAQGQAERPSGALDGKIVYLHAGHGWTANNLGSGSWTTQRGETFEIVEDLLNQDIHTYQAESLWNAGATVVPLRPIGHQPLEVVLDNVDPEVTFVGAWNNSVSPIYFGDVGETPYRFAATAPVETAVARYMPSVPKRDVYPVYAWTRAGSDRVDQLYRVLHAGGTTEVRVDHTKVGTGLVYLGSYTLAPGEGHGVEISNQSDESGVVIADMIRFGNGMGDIDRGGGVSGQTREDEAALYWIQAHLGQGTPTSAYRVSGDDGTATVGAAPRWAAHMNRQQSGTLADRVFVSHHSNAAGGVARGVIALYNGNNNPQSETPNQFLLAFLLADEINQDMPLLNQSFEHDWAQRSVITLDRTDFEFGEISNLVINNEFDATIVERGFHDNQIDAELLRDPKVSEASARSTTQGLVRYFNQVDGGATPVAFAPARVAGVHTAVDDAGVATISWDAPPAGAAIGDAAQSYRIQVSMQGDAFHAGVAVMGTSTTIATPADGSPIFVRIVAVNEGGWSPPSAVAVAARGRASARLLVVDGFDRLDRLQNIRQPYFSGETDRVRERFQNPRNSVVRIALAARDVDSTIRIESADNDALLTGQAELDDAHCAVWLLGDESFGSSLTALEQQLADAFVGSGGDLIVTGSEAAWDLNVLNTGPIFLFDTLGAIHVSGDSQSGMVAGTAGSPLDGLTLEFDRGLGVETYSVRQPDVISPLGPASMPILSYVGGTGGAAGIYRQGESAQGDTILLGFPLETVKNGSDRRSLFEGLFDLLGFPETPGCLADTNGDGVATPADFNAWILAFNTASPTCDQNSDGLCTPADFNAWILNFNLGC